MTADFIPFERAAAQDYSLQVEVGNAATPDGITRVLVDGLGNIQAAQYHRGDDVKDREQSARETEQVKGQLKPEEAARLFEQASLASWDRRFPPRPGIPDEAIVELRLQRAKREGASMKLWLRDAEKDQVIGPLLEQLRRSVGELSGGRIYL